MFVCASVRARQILYTSIRSPGVCTLHLRTATATLAILSHFSSFVTVKTARWGGTISRFSLSAAARWAYDASLAKTSLIAIFPLIFTSTFHQESKNNNESQHMAWIVLTQHPLSSSHKQVALEETPNTVISRLLWQVIFLAPCFLNQFLSVPFTYLIAIFWFHVGWISGSLSESPFFIFLSQKCFHLLYILIESNLI